MPDHDPDPAQSKMHLLDMAETIAGQIRSIAIKVDTGIIPKERVEEMFQVGAAGLLDIMESYESPAGPERALTRFLKVIHTHGGPKGPEYADLFEQTYIKERERREQKNKGS